MTFREFAILIVRLQALWVIFPLVVELTYFRVISTRSFHLGVLMSCLST